MTGAPPDWTVAAPVPEPAPTVPSDPGYGDYFDGRSALRRRAALSATSDRLRLVLPDGGVVDWPAEAIRRLPDRAAGAAILYGRTGASDRLLVTPEAAGVLAAQLGERVDRRLPIRPLWRRAAVMVAGGGALVAALMLGILPALAWSLARLLDPAAEVAMGDAVHDDVRSFMAPGLVPLRECDAPAGRAALNRLTTRVTEGLALPYDLRVTVLDDRGTGIANAFALPGGRVTFLASLIEMAGHPDEIAAILAHELGHVVHRDPVRHQLQSFSGMAVASVLLGDVTGGGVLGGAAGAALTASYSRRAEAAADAFAYRQLTAAGLPPSAMARAFERLRDAHGEDPTGFAAHFSTHPDLLARIEAAGAAGDPPIGAPSLTPKDWQALRAICG